MPKSNSKVKRKYVEKFNVLKKNYDDVCQKNAKFIKVNNDYHLAEQKWGKENSYLCQENSLEVTRVMKLRKSLEVKEKEIIDLKKEIGYLKKKLRKKELEEMKEGIPSDF